MSQPMEGTRPRARIDIRPDHVIGSAGVVAVMFALVSDAHAAWVLVAVGCGVGALMAHQRDARWSAEAHAVLAARGLTRAEAPSHPGPAADPLHSFRPMSLPALFLFAGRVMLRHCVSLIGVPFAILLAVFVVFFAAVKTTMAVVFDAHTEVVGSVAVSYAETTGDVWTTLAAMLAVMLVVCVVVAFPADAFLLSVTVLATYRAVVGHSVATGEIVRESRRRIGAVCRLTGAFYAISLAPNVLLILVLLISPASIFGVGYSLLSLAIGVGMFMLGLMLSFAPFVMMVEKRNVTASFRRSLALAKPALGRLLLIHLLFSLTCVPLYSLTFMLGTSWVLFALIVCTQWAFFRTLQMAVYIDLRTRYEDFGAQLHTEWTRNVQSAAS